MSLRGRTLTLCAASLVAVLVFVGLALYALWSAQHFVRRIEVMQRRVAILSALETDANAYTEKVAGVLLAGRGERDALGAARVRMERTFANLTRVTRAEIITLRNMNAVEAELPKVDNARRMLELYHGIDMSANQALKLKRVGEPEQANLAFQRNVEFRITNELQPLLQNDLSQETAKMSTLAGRMRHLEFEMGIAVVAAAVLAIAGVGALAVMFHRAVVVRLHRLFQHVDAMADGDIDNLVPIGGHDELFALVGRLHRMGAESADERTRLTTDIEALREDLLAAKAQLDAIDATHTQFLADIGHELRTPLTILRGEADVALRATGAGADNRLSLERIRGQAIELADLLEQMIAYARSDAETRPDTLTEVALDEVVQAAAQEGQIFAEPREITFDLKLEDNGCRLVGDFRRIKQALMIGLDNAVKHSPPGSRVRLETDIAGRIARVRIIDEGPGIAPEDLRHVFERFYRGQRESETIGDGLGIGLAIARQIVEQHGGTIALNNGETGGAIIEIGLPLSSGIEP